MEMTLKEIEGKKKTQALGCCRLRNSVHLVSLRVNLIKPAVEESLQASQGCLFSLPDHKEPHSPIDVEEAYVGLTVH